jgi:N-acetylmuramic acid 6-phosphate etherase
MTDWANLSTEQLNPASDTIDELPTVEMLAVINGEDAKVASALQRELSSLAEIVDMVTVALRAGGRLFYVGAGSSGRLGILDAAECPPTFGTDPEMVQALIAGGPGAVLRAVEGVEDDPNMGCRDVDRMGVRSNDVVIGIAASGVTPYVLGALSRAGSAGSKTVLLTCSEQVADQVTADVTVFMNVGPEVIAGSTRMKSGTATKMALNMISTGTMIRLGKTYGNLMVDLKPTNNKLRDRSRRILGLIAGVDPRQAEEQLQAAGGSLKVALVMALAGVGAGRASSTLAEHQGAVKPAVAAASRQPHGQSVG